MVRRWLGALLGAVWVLLVLPPASAPAAPPQPGRIEGTVRLACAPDAANCRERRYQVPLQLLARRSGQPPQRIAVSQDGSFAVAAAPGTYTIISGDTRGSCCLPVLRPVTVTVAPGRTVQLRLRFEPSLTLPRR